MEGTDEPLPQDVDQPSQDDGSDSEEVVEDKHYFDKLLVHLQSFLPFLTKVIDNREFLAIQPDHVIKLQCLYDLVDCKRLSPDRLKTCRKVFYDLYDSYSSPLNYYLPQDFRTSWMKETKLNDNEQKISSEVECRFNKSNQNQNSKSELSNSILVPSTSHDKIVNNKPDSQDDLTSKNENTIDKNFENFKISDSSSSKNVLNDSMPKKNDLPEFLDSRLRLNKIIGFAANASIEKLNKSDASIPHIELTTQIFNEIIEQNNGPVLYKDMLKGINIDDIDVNYVKDVIEGIKKASCVEPVQPPPLPPPDLLDLEASRVNLISNTESNSNEIVTHDNVLLSKPTTTSRVQSNIEINKLPKTCSSNDIKQKFISALKPGTLIDLENSKVSRTSLHIESLRPVMKANEKSNDFITSVADISVPRDPRIRSKSLLSSENSISQINTHPSLISNVQNTFPTNIPTLFASNIDNSNTTLFETRAQEMSGYNDPSLPNHTNIKPSNQPFFSEHNGGSSIQFKNRSLPQNQNRQICSNDHQKNDFNQFSNSNQMHVTPSHSEPMVKYCDPVPYKSHTNDIVSKRDPRSLKNISVINRVQFRNYKEYREAKYGKEQKGFEKNKQINQAYEKIEKNNIINSSYNTFGIVNETANIKSFKIPKIKHNEDLIDNSTLKDSKPKMFESNKNNNVDVLKTGKNSKIVKKTDTILKQHIEDGQKSEIKKSTDPKKTDKLNIGHADKNIEIEITENSNIDEDLKMKTMVKNNSGKEEKYPEINLEEITVDIRREVNKDELNSKSEQNNILIEPINHKKPKKPKKYSKEKEFEKIVKEAVESSYDNVCGPRTRTRYSLLKKDETLKTSKLNSSKLELKKNNPSKNKKLESVECNKNLDYVSIPIMKDDIKPIEIADNIISSTSKDQSELVNSTTTEMLCKNQEENIVSSNEVNSTADNNPKIDEKVLIDILKNPKFMTVISIFQDENKMEKLNKLLESSDVNSNNDQLKNKDILNEEQLDINKQKKLKRKMKKEKRKRKKMKKNLSEESSNEESINNISDDNNLNQAENIVITKKKNNTLNELNKGNINSGNVCDHSLAVQHKLKSVKRKKSKETYGNFEIRKDKCKHELQDIKIVLAKYDKNIERSENCNLGISSTSNDILTNNKPINIVKAQEIKPKKPFLGPLSVKLARQKMEIERNNSRNKRDVKNKFKFETKIDEKGLKSTNIYDKNGKLISETLTSLMIEQPIVVLSPLPDLKPSEKIMSNKSAVLNQNASTVIEPNVNVNKPEFKKARLSELDKLHADISEMFDCEAVLNASNIRQCRTNKQIDYVNTNIVLSKKKKASNIEQVDSNDDQIELICGVEKLKDTKKKVKKSIHKLKKEKKYNKQSMVNKTLPPVIVKTAVLNKMSNKQPNKFKKKKGGNKKFKKSSRNQLNSSINNVVLNDESELNDVSNNVISTEIIPKVLSENDFKDKSYFQTSDNILECKFCNYKDKGLNIVRHYKNQHCREEVLPSRLSKNCIESLIHQSIKENFGYQNSQDSKTFCLGSVNDIYTCVFCQVIFHDYFKFHDHITSHTGEYRFKCKMCDHIYSNEDELDIHILEHTDYDKTNGISNLVYPNPIWSKVVFGYLCSFCYYVQLDYNNTVKHMESRHFYEDKKLNNHWTVIRISMSMADENYINSSISFDNLEGCLPPIEADQIISKNNEDQNQQLTVRDLIIQSKKQIQFDSILSIKKEYFEQNINTILPETIIDENLSKIPIFENPPDSAIDNNLPKSSIDKNPQELNNGENPSHLTDDNNSAKSSIDKNPPELNNDKNLPESVFDVNPPESNMLIYLPEQDYQSPINETRISTEESDVINSEYTLKENSTKCVLAGLSCELINSILLFKCSVLNCLENQFSTVIFNDFYKHINQNHRFVVWDGKCEACHHNFKLVSEQYYVKNAFEHLVSHHLVLKSNEQSDPIINLGGSKIDQTLTSCLDMAKNSPIIVEKSLRVRCLPGDTLSIREASMTNEEKTNLFEDNRVFVLRNDLTQGIIGNISCKKINNVLSFQCIDESCPNTCSTIFYNEFVKHIQSYHKITSWNGMCSICGSGFWRNFSCLFMENALEHLVSHHLFECQKNVYSAHKPSNSSISNNCDNTSVNKPPSNDSNSINKNVNLSINHSSNDASLPFLSSSNVDVKRLKKVKVNTFKMNSSASDNDDLNMWMKTKTNCELVLPNSEIFLEAGQQIVNNGIPIDGTIYLIDTAYKKDYDKKVRDLPMNVMKTKLAFNEMSALPRLLGLFKCMDRTCTKIFNSKELFKLHMKLHFSNTEKRKRNQIYNVEQFKMCAYCFKVFDDEESLANHIVDKYTFCEYFCPYCFYRAYTASHVLVHQSIIHTKISKHLIIKLEYDNGAFKYPKETLSIVDFKEFVLPYKCNVGCCAFSCYLHNEFTAHLNEEHQQCDKFCCYICANEDDGEGFFALHPNLMITHFKLHNLNKYQCIFCLFGSEIIDSMIKHLAFEHFEYEPLCLERSTVSDNCDSKNIKNLKILRLKKVIENGIIEIVNLPADTVSLPEVLPQKSKKRSIECPDVLSVAMKSARIHEESQPSDTIVITVPDRAQMTESSTSLSIDNEFIMIDDVKQNDMQESLKIDCIWSESKNKEKEPKISSNDDIIVIDDEDEVDLSEKKGLEDPTKQICLEREESTTNGSNKTKRLAFPIIELDKLFFCKECDIIFSNGEIYFAHLNECPFWDSVAGQKCIYCVKVFKTPINMTEHIKLHGPDRFQCFLCRTSVPSQRAIAHHMRTKHCITNLDFVPKHPDFTNLNKDDFIVLEDTKVEQKKQKINNLLTCNKCSFKGNTRKAIMSHMKDVHNAEQNIDCEDNSYGKIMPDQPNDTNNSVNSLISQQNTSLKRKRSTNSGNQKGPLKVKPIIKDKTKNLCFSPDTIDSIPKSHIFSDPIGCLLCTYNTKVRSNLIIHLNGHTKGQDNTTKEIVNPVPSIGKSELMFDKMINLSASSFDAMNTEKMKRDELDKKIVEVAPDDNFKTEIFPQFVPKNMRYKCSIPLCNYTGMTEEMLKSHISILHSTYQCYICPHCLPPCITSKTVERNQIEFHLMHHGENLYKCQYCDYIDFNRVEMRTHMRNTHLSEITNSVQSNMIVIRKTMLEDDSIDRGRSKVSSNVARWVCNMCTNSLRYTENEITSHILIVHKVTNMFKCPMCQFENKDDNASTFEEHYKSQHPSVAVKCLRVFEMITDKEESHKKYLGGAENILEQQALESIEPTLVPPTCRGIPIDSTPLKMNNKSRGVSKSPKSATKNSSIQPHKQKTLIDVFNKNDKLGTISSNGNFVCPKCYVFETINIELFREHLYKEVNYKTWKCLKCFEISDSPKKMAWHVKKHGIGSKYEKIEDGEKLKWVDRVIGHQHLLLTEFNKNNKAKHVKSVESNKTFIVNNKRTSHSPIKKKNIEHEKKAVLISQLSPDPVSNDDIINLVDDSDDE